MFEKTKQRYVKPCAILHAAKGIGASIECEERAFRTYGKVEVQVGEVSTNEADWNSALEALQARAQLIVDNLHVTESVVVVLDSDGGITESITLRSDESEYWADILFDLVQSSVDGPGVEEQIACATVSIPAGDCSYLVALDCTSTLPKGSRTPQYRYVASLVIAENGEGQESIATRLSGTI